MEKRNRIIVSVARVLMTLLLYCFIQEIVYYLLFLLMHRFGINVDNLSPFNKATFTSAYLIAAAIITIIILYKFMLKTVRFKKRINVKSVLTVKNTALIIVLGVFINLFIGSIIELFNIMQFFSDYEASIASFSGGNYAVTTALVFVFAPLCEEIVNRGIVYGSLIDIMPHWVANIIQATIFGIMHNNPLQMLYAFILGIILGYVYEKYKTLWAPIILHAAFNLTTQITNIVLSEKMLDSIILMSSIMVISGLVLLIALYMLYSSKKYEYEVSSSFQMYDISKMQ